MSNFKLSWLKLDVNILDDTKIKILRKYPGGNDLIVLWLGIMCLAMKSDDPGNVEISQGIPYDAESLGYELGIETKTVELGLTLFVKFKMVEIKEGGLIEVINFSKHQDLDRIEYRRQQNRERQAKFREKNKSNALLISESHGSTDIREDKRREEENNNKMDVYDTSVIISALQSKNLKIKIEDILKIYDNDIQGTVQRIEAYYKKGESYVITAIRDKYDVPKKKEKNYMN